MTSRGLKAPVRADPASQRAAAAPRAAPFLRGWHLAQFSSARASLCTPTLHLRFARGLGLGLNRLLDAFHSQPLNYTGEGCVSCEAESLRGEEGQRRWAERRVSRAAAEKQNVPCAFYPAASTSPVCAPSSDTERCRGALNCSVNLGDEWLLFKCKNDTFVLR